MLSNILSKQLFFTMELFCENSQSGLNTLTVSGKNPPPQMFDWILNVLPIGGTVNVESR